MYTCLCFADMNMALAGATRRGAAGASGEREQPIRLARYKGYGPIIRNASGRRCGPPLFPVAVPLVRKWVRIDF